MNFNFNAKDYNLSQIGLGAIVATGVLTLGFCASRYFKRPTNAVNDRTSPLVDNALANDESLNRIENIESPHDQRKKGLEDRSVTVMDHVSLNNGASSSSGPKQSNSPNKHKVKKHNHFARDDSEIIKGLDLAGRTKSTKRIEDVKWLDLANSPTKKETSELFFEMPIRLPVLMSPNNAYSSDPLTPERLLTDNPLEQMILGSNTFNSIPKILGIGPGRSNSTNEKYQTQKIADTTSSRYITCSSSSQASSSSSSSQASSSYLSLQQNLSIDYFDQLEILINIIHKIKSEIQIESNSENFLNYYKEAKLVKNTLLEILKNKLDQDINEEYLFDVIHQLGEESSRIFLDYLGLSSNQIESVLLSFNAQSGTYVREISLDQKIKSFLDGLSLLQSNLGDIKRVDSLISKFSSSDVLKNVTDKKVRSELINNFKTSMSKITTFNEAQNIISDYKLELALIDSFCKNVKKSNNLHIEKNFIQNLIPLFVNSINFLVKDKFVGYEKLDGLPILPQEILDCLYQAGFKNSDLDGYFYVDPQLNNLVTKNRENSIPGFQLDHLKNLAYTTLDRVVREQKIHSSARFRDLVRMYRNFVVRAHLIAKNFSFDDHQYHNLLNEINGKIIALLKQPKTKNAHRLLQGNNHVSPGTVKSIIQKISYYCPQIRNKINDKIDLEETFLTNIEKREVLFEINKRLELHEKDLINNLSFDIDHYVNKPDIHQMTQFDLRMVIKNSILDNIAAISNIKLDDQIIVMNLDILLPRITIQFIQDLICTLQIKQLRGCSTKEVFTGDYKKVTALLSLLTCSSNDTATDFKIQHDRLNSSEAYIKQIFQKAHTLPYPLLFFPDSIPTTHLPITEKIFQRYKGHTPMGPNFKRTEHLNKAFINEIKKNSSLDLDSIIHLSFRIAQIEFSEISTLPKIVNSDIDAISEFRGFDHKLQDILIDCVDTKKMPKKLDIYKKLTPYFIKVLEEIESNISETKLFKKQELKSMLKMVMICNLLQSIITAKPTKK